MSGEVRFDLKARPHRSGTYLRYEDYGSLNNILQLTNVPRPFAGLAQLERIFVDFADSLSHLLRGLYALRVQIPFAK
jgi:hypothetical protein